MHDAEDDELQYPLEYELTFPNAATAFPFTF